VAYVDHPASARGQSLDVYAPAKASGAPMLLFFHGGVWRIGDKEEYANVGRTFAGRGIVTAVVNYRLVPSATHAEQLQDAARAIGWAFAHARECGADARKIYLAGHSAGAELISTLLFEDDLLKAHGVDATALAGIIPLSGIFDLTRPIDDSTGGGFDEYIHPVFGEEPEVLKRASPISRVAKRGVPWLVLVAGDDSLAMQSQSREFAEALDSHGVDPRLRTIADRGHFELITEIGSPGDATTDAVAEFIRSRGSPPPEPAPPPSSPPPRTAPD
jgi:acetyl esterase/lipase